MLFQIKHAARSKSQVTKFDHEYMFLGMENAIKLVNSCLLIVKALKIQDGCQISRQQNVSATDVPFLLML